MFLAGGFALVGCLFFSVIAKNELIFGRPAGLKQVLGFSTEAIRGAQLENQASARLRYAFPETALEAISAEAFSVIDESNMAALFEKNPDKPLPIASLTKLMTALLAYENLNLSEIRVISRVDLIETTPNLGLAPGNQIGYLNLLEAVLVCSANDASMALANAVQERTHTNFSDLMNQRARGLGLTQTLFSNPLGFDSVANYSSINDLKILTKVTQNFGAFKNLGKKTEVSFTDRSNKRYGCKASNKMLNKNFGMETIKTGHTPLAKGSIIARIRRNQASLLVFVLKSQDREADFQKLSEIAFNNYSWELLPLAP